MFSALKDLSHPKQLVVAIYIITVSSPLLVVISSVCACLHVCMCVFSLSISLFVLLHDFEAGTSSPQPLPRAFFLRIEGLLVLLYCYPSV